MKLSELMGDVEIDPGIPKIKLLDNKIVKEKTLSFYDVLKKVTKKINLNEEEMKTIDQFMVLKWLSGSKRYVSLANELSIYGIPNNAMILTIQEEMRKDGVSFIPFVKKEKDIYDKETKALLISVLAINEAKLYDIASLISDDEIKNIKLMYNNKKNKRKKK